MPKSMEPIASKKIISELKQACDIRDYETQLKCYQVLGDYYLTEKKDPINAIALYNFALAIAGDAQKNLSFSKKDYVQIIIDCIKKAEQHFLLSATNQPIPPSDYALDKSHQAYLQSIRDEARAQLQRHQILTEMITSQLPTDISRLNGIRAVEAVLEREQVSIRQIYKTINEQLRGFVRLLIEECKQVLNEPPCDYAIICFGSLARDEATPYSDLEFGILIEDITEKYPKEMLYYGLEQGDYPLLQQLEAEIEQYKTYFRNLTKLLNIKILNLGETTPRMQDIVELREIGLTDRYSESPTKKGFCFDGNNQEGRKTPLGNKEFNEVPEDKKYELILMPKEMAQLHNEEWYQKDKHLSTVLGTYRLIEGNKALFNTYLVETSKLLDQPVELINRENKLYLSKLRQKRALELLADSHARFELKYGIQTKEGHFLNPKYDFYRLLDMLVEHLSLFYTIETNNIWERVDVLLNCDVFNEIGAKNLQIAITEITKIRLLADLNSGSHDSLNKIPDEDSFEIYATLIPMYFALRSFVFDDVSAFRNADFFEMSDFVKGVFYYYSLKYEDARKYLTQAIRNKDIRGYIYMGHILMDLDENAEAKEYFLKLIKLYDVNTFNDMTVHHISCLAVLEDRLNKEDEENENAIELAEASIALVKNEQSKISLLINLAAIYSETELLLKAVACNLAAYEACVKYYSPNFSETLTALNNLVLSLIDLSSLRGESDKAYLDVAKDLLLEQMKLDKQAYGEYHINYAYCLNHLGLLYSDGYMESRLAIPYFEKALGILSRHYNNHSVIAQTHANLHGAYLLMGDFASAEQHKKIERTIYDNLKEDTSHCYSEFMFRHPDDLHKNKEKVLSFVSLLQPEYKQTKETAIIKLKNVYKSLIEEIESKKYDFSFVLAKIAKSMPKDQPSSFKQKGNQKDTYLGLTPGFFLSKKPGQKDSQNKVNEAKRNTYT